MKANINIIKEEIQSKEREILQNTQSNDSLKSIYEDIRILRNEYSKYLLDKQEYALLLRDKLDSIHFAEKAIMKYLDHPACISIIGDFVMNCNHINLYINLYGNDNQDIYYDVIQTEANVLTNIIDHDITKGYVIIDLDKELTRIQNEIEKKETSINEQ